MLPFYENDYGSEDFPSDFEDFSNERERDHLESDAYGSDEQDYWCGDNQDLDSDPYDVDTDGPGF